MYDASAGTLTDQVAVPLLSAEVAVKLRGAHRHRDAHTGLRTGVARYREPGGLLVNVHRVVYVAIASRFSTSAPAACTVTVNMAVASS